MLKFLLLFVVVCSSGLLGFSFSQKLFERKRVLESFYLLIKNSATKIRYTTSPLSVIFSDNFMGYNFVEDIPFASQWKTMLKSYLKLLDIKDIEVLTEFGECIGTSDVTGEMNNIELYLSLLNECVQNAEQDIKNKSRLYKTLGLSLGIVISILLV